MNIFLLVCTLLTVLLMWTYVRRLRAQGTQLPWWLVVERGIAVAILLIMVLAVGYQVAIRYGLHEWVRAPWSDELSRLLLVWLVFWGAASLQRSDEHISMPLVLAKLPDKAQLVARLLGDAVTITILGVLAYHGFQVAQGARATTTLTLGYPTSVFHLAVPVSATLMILHTLIHVYLRLRGREIPEDPAAEVY